MITDKPRILEAEDNKALFPAHTKSSLGFSVFQASLTSGHRHTNMCPGNDRQERPAPAIKHLSLEVTHIIYTHIPLTVSHNHS